MKKKIASILLAALMLVSLLPLSAIPAFAEPDGEWRQILASSTEGQTIGKPDAPQQRGYESVL